MIPFFKSICAPPMILPANEIFPLLFLRQFKSSFAVDVLPRSSSHSHECTCTRECAHSHIYRVTNANSFLPSVLSGSSRTPRSSRGWWDSRSSRNHVDATGKKFFSWVQCGLTTRGRCIIPFIFFFPFSSIFQGIPRRALCRLHRKHRHGPSCNRPRYTCPLGPLSSFTCQHLGHFKLLRQLVLN